MLLPKEPDMATGTASGASRILAIILILIGIVSLATRELIDSTVWILLGIAILLSVTQTSEEWRARPWWLRAISIGVTCVALLLGFYRIVMDLVT
jgi:hypothetical protein